MTANLYLLDNNKITIGVLSNRMPFSLPFYNDLQEKSLDDLTDTLTFTIPANHPQAVDVDADKYILYPDIYGNYKLYKVMEVTEVSNASEYSKEVYCEISAQDDLLKDVVRPTTFTNAELDEVLTYILNGSDWRVGSIESLPAMEYKIEDYGNKLEALVKAVQAYGGELVFNYDVRGTTISGQYVDVFEKVGNVTGKTFMHGKDIKGVERKESSTKLVTALIGIGKADEAGVPMTFANKTIVGIPEGYEVPTGADWVGSIKAQELYSKKGEHVFGVYKDDNARSPQELFDNTLKALQNSERPLVTYKVDVALLERIAGYEHERAEIGDTILVQDKTIQPELYLQARIRKMARSLTNPANDSVELGDYIPITPPVNKRLAMLQDKISKQESIWDKASEIPSIQEKLEQVPTMDDVFSQINQRLKIRYVRDYINGSNVDEVNHWAEIQVFRKGINIAKGIAPTFDVELISGEASYVTDGIIDYSRTASTGAGLHYAQIDFGQVMTDVEYMQVWHYYGDDRIFNNHYVDVSEDGLLWIRMYNSDKAGVNVETSDGLLVPINSSAIISTNNKNQNEIIKDIEDLEDFKQSAEYQLEQKVNLVDYNNKIKDLNQSIADKAGLEYVNGQLMDKANKDEVVTIDVIENAVNSMVSKTEYETDEQGRIERFESAETRIEQTEKVISLKADATVVDGLTGDIKDLATKVDVTAEGLASKVTKEEAKKIAELENSINFRYIRLIGQGNNIDSNFKIVEVAANDGDGVNVALNKPVTAGNEDATDLSFITDGDYTDSTLSADLGANNESQWAMIDLGKIYDNIANIMVWLDWSDDTKVYEYEVQVSEDAVNWISMYDSNINGNYTPTDAGFEIFVNQQKAIYSHATQLRQTAESISLKADATIVDDLGTRLSNAEELITADAIISTVTSSQSFSEALEDKADRSELDGKADADALDDIKDNIENNLVTKTELSQTAKEINLSFSSAGGVNVVKNSVGYANTDFWLVTGLVDAVQNPELVSKGAGSGFALSNATMSQTLSVKAGQYSISALVKKNAQGTGYIKATYDGNKVKKIDFINGTQLDYAVVEFVIDVGGSQIDIELQGTKESGIIFTSLMVNVGAIPLQWSHATGEVYNANVQINGNGITVRNSTYKGYTSITPEEFAGYYEVDGQMQEVFTLNKDTTIIAKAEIKQEIHMTPMKIVPIQTNTLSGWAFVANDE